MKHIAIFNTSGDAQTALNEETLVNPYVALVSGAVDFNELTPVAPNYKGVWSHEYVTESGVTVYTFTLIDTDMSDWTGTGEGYKIATIPNAYYEGAEADVEIYLGGMLTYDWEVIFTAENASDDEVKSWYDGGDPGRTQTTSRATLNPLDDSDVACVNIEFDGATFKFWSTESICDLVMNTINPVDE